MGILWLEERSLWRYHWWAWWLALLVASHMRGQVGVARARAEEPARLAAHIAVLEAVSRVVKLVALGKGGEGK